MKLFFEKTLSFLVIITLSACVYTRDPVFTVTKQEGDTELTCKNLALEYKSNNQVAAEKIRSNRKHDRKELWWLLVWPGLLDFKNADGAEANSLLDRNIRLLAIAKDKNCNTSSWPTEPGRY